MQMTCLTADSSTPLLSVIAPVYNEEGTVLALVDHVKSALAGFGERWEFIVVNDGSADSTLELLLRFHREDCRIKVLDLSRNFGHQRALLAGLTYASGSVVACIDGDLQDSPTLIPAMLKSLDTNDADVVYGVRRERKENAIKKMAYWLAYRILNRLMNIDLPLDSGDFAVMRRPVVDAILRMPEQSLFLRGLRAWVGFRQIPFEYERAPRFAGASKYRWKDLFRLAYDGLFSFTEVPIRLLGLLGIAAVASSTAYSIFLFVGWFLGLTFPQGFTTLVLAVMFFSGVQLLALRIIGAYIHRIYDEVRSRPPFLVRQFWGTSSPPPTRG